MKVVFVSSEIVPFASTGGLGDVSAALPKALAAQGVEIVRILPLYQQIDHERYRIEPCNVELHVPLGQGWYCGCVWKQVFEGVTTYFIRSREFFDRPGIYGCEEHGYADNFERFLFFQKAAVRLIDVLDLKPDLVHCNDWQAALIPMLLHHGIDGKFRDGSECTLMTIHNLAHHGWAPAEKFYMTNLPDSCYTMYTLEFYGEINMLKGGLVAATAINAVSPTYAEEIKTAKFGCRLNGVLYHRRNVLHGILNGIDYKRWNPETDQYLPAHFSKENLAGKAVCKKALQHAAGLPDDARTPLLGVISRLVPQKGIDVLAAAMERIIAMGAQVIILGTGDRRYEEACRAWVKRWPNQVSAWIEFSSQLAHQIEAGADMFLMPSEFEPCGQNQMYSMRYGTIPVVHGVGGLEDSVIDYDEPDGTGFKFHGHTSDKFADCIERALTVYADAPAWQTLMKRAMEQDFSVVHMARQYIDLYEAILSGNAAVD
ncbi:MAG: glycogen synthase GlgA [Pontiellaceae bacterium]|nr:glycogen synthase GlgA [Pontiellaceae bacterium]